MSGGSISGEFPMKNLVIPSKVWLLPRPWPLLDVFAPLQYMATDGYSISELIHSMAQMPCLNCWNQKRALIEVPCMFESSANVQHSRILRTHMPAAQHLGETHFPPLSCCTWHDWWCNFRLAFFAHCNICNIKLVQLAEWSRIKDPSSHTYPRNSPAQEQLNGGFGV